VDDAQNAAKNLKTEPQAALANAQKQAEAKMQEYLANTK
jgi:hypothetical protein